MTRDAPSRVLVTGGAGFIGACLVRLLLREGHTVRVLDDLRNGREEYLEGLGAEVVRGDIVDTDLVTELARDADAVVTSVEASS